MFCLLSWFAAIAHYVMGAMRIHDKPNFCPSAMLAALCGMPLA
jgi:hypothetical protein